MRNRRGFTLIEILVVVAIIAVLAGLLLPLLGRSRERALETTCTSNLRQIGLQLAMYRQDFGSLPTHLASVADHGGPGVAHIFQCPADPTGNLGYLTQGNMTHPQQLPGPVGISYLYLMHYALPNSPLARCYSGLPGNPGLVVCVAHGTPSGPAFVQAPELPYPTYTGRELRLRMDGSVAPVPLPVTPDSWSALRLFLWKPGMPLSIDDPCVHNGRVG